jgi:excinuclease ABC subunit A
VSIQQSNPARSARSTVATATEVHDYLRLLFARLGTVHCGKCGRVVTADSPQSIAREAAGWPAEGVVLVLAPVALARKLSWAEQAGHLLRAGYTRAWIDGAVVDMDPVPALGKGAREVHVVVDRFKWRPDERERLVEACEQAFRRGEGKLAVVRGDEQPDALQTNAGSAPTAAPLRCAPSRRCSRSTARSASARPAGGSATC